MIRTLLRIMAIVQSSAKYLQCFFKNKNKYFYFFFCHWVLSRVELRRSSVESRVRSMMLSNHIYPPISCVCNSHPINSLQARMQLSQLQTRVEDSCDGCKRGWTKVMDHLIQENYYMEAYKVELHLNMQIFLNNMA